MKRKIMIACCFAVALSAAVGCAKADGNGKNGETAAEQEEKSDERSAAADFIGDATKVYLSISDDDTAAVASMMELNGADSAFVFVNDMLSSLASAHTEGSFSIEGGVLTAVSADGEKKLLFEIEDKDTLRFMQDGSSEIVLSGADDYKKVLADRTVFKMEEMAAPSKEEVLAMREKALAGMTDAEKKDLTDKVKAANECLEREWVNGNLFDRLADPEDLYWNLLEQKGEIQTGWAFSDGKEYDESSGMSFEEYAEKYGERVVADNEYDAEDLIKLIKELEGTLKNDLLKPDFENLAENIRQAKETHDAAYVKQAYFILHDMDYFLLRYGMEDVGKKVQDMSMVSIYRGALEIYNN